MKAQEGTATSQPKRKGNLTSESVVTRPPETALRLWPEEKTWRSRSLLINARRVGECVGEYTFGGGPAGDDAARGGGHEC